MRAPAVLLLALTAGCSLAVEDEVDVASAGVAAGADASLPGGSIQGAVIVDQIAAGSGAKTRVSARFVRVSGGIDQAAAEQLIGAPRFDTSSPLGCSLVEGEELDSAGGASTGGSIELLDVGELFLHYTDDSLGGDDTLGGSVAVPLAARAFPDVGELVSGIVYTSRDGDEVIPFGGSFSIESSGSAQLDGFTLRVEAPPPLSEVTLLSPSLASPSPGGAVAPREWGELDDLVVAGDDLVLGWGAGQSSRGDRIYVDVTPDESGARRTLRCVFEDDGEAIVPAALIDHRPGTVLEVEVHRHRRTAPHDVSSSLRGLHEAVVDFDFAVATRVLITEYAGP